MTAPGSVDLSSCLKLNPTDGERFVSEQTVAV